MLRMSKIPIVVMFVCCHVAGDWDCDARFTHGPSETFDQNLNIEIDKKQASISSAGFTYKTGILGKKGEVYEYSEQQTSATQDERITTSTYFRFDEGSGELIFFSVDPEQILIKAKCSKD